MKPSCLIALVALLVGCSTTGSTGNPLIPAKSLALTDSVSVAAGTIASAALVAGAIYLIYDPLAPNWEIEEEKLSGDTYRFALKMKRYHTGGSGESLQILKRRARVLQAESGFSGYQLLDFSEGIDSVTLGAQRVAEGTIRLISPLQADSFGLN